MDYETPVNLPTSSHGEYLPDQDWIIVHVKTGGEVLFGDTPVTLDELEAHMAREPKTRPILLCADAAVPYIHIAWVCGSIDLWPFQLDSMWLGVRRGTARRAFDARIPGASAPAAPDPWWKRWLPGRSRRPYTNLIPDFDINIVFRDGDGPITFECGPEQFNSRSQLRARLRAGLEDTEHPIKAGVNVDIRVSYQTFVHCLDDLRDAGVDWPMWAAVRAHPWVRRQRRLPEPDRAELATFPDHRQSSMLEELVLPITPAAVENDDADDRIILNMDAEGAILFRGMRRNLDELRTLFNGAKRVANLRLKPTDNTCEAPQRPRLFVLLRADRNAPWLHVQWFLGVMREERLLRLELAAMSYADADYFDDEARELAAPVGRQIPFVPVRNGKLEVPQPEAPRSPELRIYVEAHGTGERNWGRHRVPAPTLVTYNVDGRSTRNLAELSRWLDALAEKHDVVQVNADPRVPYKYVVAAAGCARSAGIDEIDFVAVKAMPHQRHGQYLPYPGTTTTAQDEGR